MSADSHAAIEAVWRLEAPRLTAGLMRLVRDLGAAEDLAHDALVAALEQWPSDGVPRLISATDRAQLRELTRATSSPSNRDLAYAPRCNSATDI